MYVFLDVCIYTNTHTHTHTPMHAYIHTYSYTYVNVCAFVCVCVRARARAYIYVGKSCHSVEPGFFRICYAWPAVTADDATVAMRELKTRLVRHFARS
jgi:hypothetical protein